GLLVRGVADARVREHVHAWELISRAAAATAGGVRARSAAEASGMEPEALFALGEEVGRAVEVRPGAAGVLDVLFHPAGGLARFPAEAGEERPWEAYANDPQWGRRIRALVPELRASVRARLPEHMLPSAFVVLESFPVTPNGKVDRQALPAPDLTVSEGVYVAPRTPSEGRMAAIWAEVLGTERVGAEDNFFEMGGHSLLATQVASRVREAFGVELPLRAVFEAPTVSGLSGRVDVLLRAGGPAQAPPIVPVPRDRPLPLSFGQQRLWFLDSLEPGSTAYGMPMALRLRGALDGRAVARTVAEVARRHEALRTTFDETDGEPVQVVHPAGAVRLPAVDLSGLPEGAREAEALRIVGDDERRPFDLRRGPLFYTRLLRLDADDHVLLLCMHHIVSDGWSMGVLFREVAALYEAFSRGAPSPLPSLPVQYADFAVWQREWLAGDVLERQLAWWRERLEGAPAVLEIPTDHPRRASPGSRGATVFRLLPRGAGERLRSLGRGEGATLYMVLLAALDVLLARWSGEDDVVVGTPIANRGRRELEGLIGFFVNTLALRTDVSGSPTFRDLLRRVRETVLGAFAHQELPFEKLVEGLGVERSLSHSPVFQVMFSLIDGDGAPRSFAGLGTEHFGEGSAPAKFDLSVTVMEMEEGLGVDFSYRAELWDAASVERMLDAYALLLDAVAEAPERRVLELALVRVEERRMLEEWSARDADAALVHRLFAAQAARTPEATALWFRGERLTYAELDRRANRLANHLRALGVGPETRVGVCLERTPELVVALLGVLKAGGAYVPLDPAYPRERLGWMLEDAGARLVLAESALADRLPAGPEVV
ncbi:MAG TPA: condensation domain-containing protein, partial [Longimicrobiaceae bacterium]